MVLLVTVEIGTCFCEYVHLAGAEASTCEQEKANHVGGYLVDQLTGLRQNETGGWFHAEQPPPPTTAPRNPILWDFGGLGLLLMDQS